MAPGSLVGNLIAHDADEEETLNSQLTYSIVSLDPVTAKDTFLIDATSGRIQALRSLQRKDQQVYNLNVNVSDPGNTNTSGCNKKKKKSEVFSLTASVYFFCVTVFSTVCKVIIKVIDVNNEMPLFEKSDVSLQTLCLSLVVLFVFPHGSDRICLQYGTYNLTEDTPVGHTVLTIRATDADDPDSGSSHIEFHVSAGDDDELFAVKTDGKGVGYVVIAKV